MLKTSFALEDLNNAEVAVPNCRSTRGLEWFVVWRGKVLLDAFQRSRIATAWLVFWICCATSLWVEAQIPAAQLAYPTPEYYLAYEVLKDGQTLQALQGFQASLRRAKQFGNERFIDSIPAMVLAGECLFHQGNLAAAMEHYDAALTLAIKNPAWLANLQPAGLAGARSDPKSKGINWLENMRRTRLGNFSRYWVLNLGPNGLVIGLPNGATAAVAETIQLDALEILRCQAIALRRRAQILGPLASKSPLSDPLVNLYRLPTTNLAPVLRAAYSICNALATLATGDTRSAAGLLKSNSSLPDGTDHPLTPLALQVLAEITSDTGDFAAAQSLLGDVTLIAAELEQFDVLAEALAWIASMAITQPTPRAVAVLRQIAVWARNRSRLAYVQALCSQEEMQTAVGNFADSQALAVQIMAILSAREVALPRLQAASRFAVSQNAFAVGNLVDGQQALEQSIAIMHGNDPAGGFSKRFFQLQLASNLVRGGQLSVQAADDILTSLLAEPSAADWQSEPLDTLAFLTSDKQFAFDTLLELKLRRGTEDEILNAVDQAQRNQFWSFLPLGGRLLSLKLLFHTDPKELPAEFVPAAERLRQNFSQVSQAAGELRRLSDDVLNRPIQLDIRDWDATTTSLWSKIRDLSTTQETRMWQVACSREPIARSFPPPVHLDESRNQWNPDDAALVFFRSQGQLHASMLTKSSTTHWSVGEVGEIDSLVAKVLRDIGVAQAKPQMAETWKQKAWQVSLQTLAQRLVPEPQRRTWRGLRRLFVVPTGNLWYLPFELLPSQAAEPSLPLVSEMRFVYVPTLGLIPRSFQSTVLGTETVAITDEHFFSNDTKADRELVEGLKQATPRTIEVAVGQSPNRLQYSRWARLRVPRVWVASPMPISNVFNLAPFAYDSGSQEGTLRSWLLLPLRSPNQISLVGLEMSVANGRSADGQEVFALACTAMANGNQSLLVSRWPVRGASCQTLLHPFLQELDSVPASEAWQRSVLSLWSVQLDIQSEPIFAAQNQGPMLIAGDSPLLWSSYAIIGDTNPKPQ